MKSFSWPFFCSHISPGTVFIFLLWLFSENAMICALPQVQIEPREVCISIHSALQSSGFCFNLINELLNYGKKKKWKIIKLPCSERVNCFFTAPYFCESCCVVDRGRRLWKVTLIKETPKLLSCERSGPTWHFSQQLEWSEDSRPVLTVWVPRHRSSVALSHHESPSPSWNIYLRSCRIVMEINGSKLVQTPRAQQAGSALKEEVGPKCVLPKSDTYYFS